MKKGLIAFIALAATLAATTVYTTQGDTETGDSQKARPIREMPSPPSWLATAHRLERESKIPKDSYKALGPKAFELTRHHEFRPIGDALTHIKQLMLRSESGDATATYEIHRTIEQCRTFTSDRADTLADSASRIGSEGWFLAKSERILKECESLVLDQDIYNSEWLPRAAAMGSHEAMRAYALSPENAIGSPGDADGDPANLDQWKDTAVGYLQELAAQGNATALGDLATAYTYGGIVDADPVLALAYTRALNRIDTRFAKATDIADQELTLSSEDRIKAQLLSNEIFKNCCIPQ